MLPLHSTSKNRLTDGLTTKKLKQIQYTQGNRSEKNDYAGQC